MGGAVRLSFVVNDLVANPPTTMGMGGHSKKKEIEVCPE